MFSIYELISYSLAVFILIVIPGPTMFYLVSQTLRQGKKAGLLSLLGVNIADLVFLILVAFGISSVLFTVPFLFTTIKIAGSFYLLYLAYKTFSQNNFSQSEQKKAKVESSLKLFSIGFLTNIINPKVILFFGAIFSQFIKPTYGKIWLQSLTLGVIFITISFLTNSVFILLASKMSFGKVKNKRYEKLQNWAVAFVLSFIALKILFTNNH
jgi:threonine/homoserine/homoserine lactone efflux protein